MRNLRTVGLCIAASILLGVGFAVSFYIHQWWTVKLTTMQHVSWFNEEQDRLQKEYDKTHPRSPGGFYVPMYGHLQFHLGDTDYEPGLRDDGVVVMRRMKP